MQSGDLAYVGSEVFSGASLLYYVYIDAHTAITADTNIEIYLTTRSRSLSLGYLHRLSAAEWWICGALTVFGPPHDLSPLGSWREISSLPCLKAYPLFSY